MKEESNKSFKQRIDYYWRSMLIYLVVLIGYSLIRGTLQNKELSFFIKDPIVILLSIFILFALIMYLYKLIWLRTIYIEKDSISFKNRFRKTTYTADDIEHIYIGKERPFQSRETYRVIKLKTKGKKRRIRIRPHNYWDDMKLYEAIKELKQNLNK